MIDRLTDKCALCGKIKGVHKAKTLGCPFGMRTRIGYTDFKVFQVFTPKKESKRNEAATDVTSPTSLL
jgi:hypothetical protein